MTALFAFAPLFATQKGRLARAVLLSLLTLGAGIGLLGVSGWFLTAAAVSTAGVAFNLFGPSAGVRGLSFLRILSRYSEKLSGHDATLRLLSQLRAATFGRLFAALPLPGLGLGRADLVNRLVADVEAVDNAFLVALGPISTAIATCLAMSLGLLVLLPMASLAYGLCFLSASVLVPLGLIALSRAAGAASVVAGARLRQAVLDSLDAHQDLATLGQTARAAVAAEAACRELASARRRLGILTALAGATMQVLAGIAMAAVLVAGIAALEAGRIDGPLFAGLLFATLASFEAAAPLIRSAGRLAGAAAAAKRLQPLGNARNALAEMPQPTPCPSGSALEFHAVRYGYDPARPTLCDVSFMVPPGRCIAIAGPRGAGKSTIARLLVRLADPDAGSITLDGVDVRDFATADLRCHIALMTQDAPIFKDTVRDNLLIGRSEADDTALWRALDAARIGNRIRALPGGLDALVAENAATLSAGEARRLALARTLLSGAEILVLDEPTNGLDRATELAFLGALREIANGRSVILITHADLPPDTFDESYRLVDGKLLPALGS
ncbi:MAG: thiol reductant ABC exporter subunit CydC [Devosia sp.]